LMLPITVFATVKKWLLKVLAISCGLFITVLLIFKDLVSSWQLLFPIYFFCNFPFSFYFILGSRYLFIIIQFVAVFKTFGKILQYLLYHSMRLVSLLLLQLVYKILLLWHDNLIPLVTHGLYLCVELSLVLVKQA
jgi:hypothetical protein